MILNVHFIKGLVDLLSPYQTHFFFPFLSLAQLPLTAAFSFSSPPALHCHSSLVSFSSPLPHGTTSVWKCCTCPVQKDSDKWCNDKPIKQFHLFMSGVNLLRQPTQTGCPASIWISTAGEVSWLTVFYFGVFFYIFGRSHRSIPDPGDEGSWILHLLIKMHYWPVSLNTPVTFRLWSAKKILKIKRFSK